MYQTPAMCTHFTSVLSNLHSSPAGIIIPGLLKPKERSQRVSNLCKALGPVRTEPAFKARSDSTARALPSLELPLFRRQSQVPD